MKTYRWSPVKKTERNKKILEAHQKNMSYRAIGRIFKISGARVQQIVKNAPVSVNT